ncbi:hypothetical protein B0H13DRAFT_2664307 [Mycena leptocephala]|nr:hypothetical protein B0H13DRAFT_2664307 [Mycena leptocephala]
MIWKLENGLHEPSTNRLMEEEMPMGSLVWCPFHARYAEPNPCPFSFVRRPFSLLDRNQTKEDDPLFSATFLLIFSLALFHSLVSWIRTSCARSSFRRNGQRNQAASIITSDTALFGHIASGPTPVPLSSSYGDPPAQPQARLLLTLDYPAVQLLGPLDHFVANQSNRVANPRPPHVPVACPEHPEAGEDRPRADVIVEVRSPDSYATIFTATLPRHAGPALSLDVPSEDQYCS